ncbi:uncharacterized protein LOC108678363 isoform X2 [Hyalella azteca]|uniref:Uncharacterized protein LOC108678363 isoform X2 n=1 Tax=Hyalella azteca TaxID=294128 RepID=A0A979FGC9_HYAAZ|nr:uncharacterized protein LOC108678363 isoform X2 [Hyalella azteca]XP_047735663.1 uncharacterized protein LOC108678363 isoform X2 [Hyalella azteca]
MKWQVLCAALTGLCLVLGGLAQGPTIRPCGAPATTENFNDAYISKLHEEGFMVVMAEGQQLSDKQLKFFDNGTYLCEYMDRTGRSAQHTGEYRAQAHAASAPATITLHSLPSGAFGSVSGTVTFSVIKAERGVLDLISCSREGLLSRARRYVLISTTLRRSVMTAVNSIFSAATGIPNTNNNDLIYELLRSGSDDTASSRQADLALKVFAITSIPLFVIRCLFFNPNEDPGTCLSTHKNLVKGVFFPTQPPALFYYSQPDITYYPYQPPYVGHSMIQHFAFSPKPAKEVVSVPYSAQQTQSFENQKQNKLVGSPLLSGNQNLGQYNLLLRG